MAEPQACTVGQSNWPTIWSVDDAWFEGVEVRRPVKNSVSLLDNNMKFENLVDSIKKAKACGLTSPELTLLEILADICIKNNWRLITCNFEYFTEHFGDANKSNNAVLLDIHYQNGRSFPSQHYGVYLLAELLSGSRFHGDIFFVTGYSEYLAEALRNNMNNPNWWVMRGIPFVIKGSNLKQELECFAKYFNQGISKDPLPEFVTALIETHKKNFAHPENISCVPQDFLLLDKFKKNSCTDCESFKALYFYDDTRDDSRFLAADIFCDHLRYANITISKDGNYDKFRLPRQPGMIFVICLVNFIRILDNAECGLTLKIEKEEGHGKASIVIPLKNPRAFQAAVDTGGGTSVKAFRELRACRNEFFSSIAQIYDLKEETFQCYMDAWKKPKPVENSRHYSPLVEYNINETLTIYWSYELPPSED